MRKLILTRGAPGCGKSRLLNEKLKLDGYIISSDVLRSLLSSPVMIPDGYVTLEQRSDGELHRLMYEMTSRRLAKGETLAVDMTFADGDLLRAYVDLGLEHGYSITIVDFSSMPDEIILEQNKRRNPPYLVPERHIKKMLNMLSNPVEVYLTKDKYSDADINVVKWQPEVNGFDFSEKIRDWLYCDYIELNSYEKVVFIGDLQGCKTVLTGDGGVLEDGIKDNVAYVFVGDLIDRGIENGELLKWFRDECLHRDNVFLIHGNHEDHLERWSKNLPAVSHEFSDKTLPQLISAGITPIDAGLIVEKTVPVLYLSWHGVNVLVCHAGLPCIPSRPELISTQQYMMGAGGYEESVDEAFDRGMRSMIERTGGHHWWQVHGHRNPRGLPLQASQYSFNLEDGVEHGGNLRSLILDATGWHPHENRNRIFAEKRQLLDSAKETTPVWHEGSSNIVSDETIQIMKNHPGVNIRSASSLYPEIKSLSFTKKVFYDQSWDSVVMRARGFFYDENTKKCVARSYDKFFDVGQREDTSLERLKDTLKFPLFGWKKENGFLGLLGYHEAADELFSSSKTFSDGSFADLFRDILKETFTSTGLDRLRRWLRDNEASMAFEVIDPINDPHIIDYDKRGLVLLDIFHRSEDVQKAPYPMLKKVGNMFGVNVKERGLYFKNFDSLNGFLKSNHNNMDYKIDGLHFEGFVFEDASGFQFKWKTPYYVQWKLLRSQISNMVSCFDKKREWVYPRNIDSYPDPSLSKNFLEWALKQDIEYLRNGNILDMRKSFLSYIPDHQSKMM